MHEYVPFQITQALCTHDAAPLMLSHPHEDKGCTKPTTACEAGPTDYGQDTSLHNELRVAASRAKYDVQGCAYKHGRKVTRAFATSSRKCFQVVQQDEQDRLVDIPWTPPWITPCCWHSAANPAAKDSVPMWHAWLHATNCRRQSPMWGVHSCIWVVHIHVFKCVPSFLLVFKPFTCGTTPSGTGSTISARLNDFPCSGVELLPVILRVGNQSNLQPLD